MTVLVHIVAYLLIALFILGGIGFFIWLCRGFWSMVKGDGPGPLPWL